MAKYIVETKGNHVTKHQLMIALVQVLGLGEVVSVENAAQQSAQAHGADPADAMNEFDAAAKKVADEIIEARRR